MTPEETTYLRTFFRNVTDKALEPTDPLYVPLYDDPRQDPVALMQRSIEWTPGESVQLLSGFRGTGKSTEVRRLRKQLREAGYIVALVDIEDYLDTTNPVDISDFLVTVAGAFGDSLVEGNYLNTSPAREGYWTRFVAFLRRTKVDISEVSTEVGTPDVIPVTASVGLKANLKSDPTFRQVLQARMAGHLGALVKDVRLYFEETVKAVRDLHGEDKEVVLIVDSLEHIRGSYTNATRVQESVEDLFVNHADKLHLPYVHVVYTVPPYMKVRYPNLGALYDPGGILMLPALKVREQGDGSTYQPGIDAIERIVAARGDWTRLISSRDILDSVILTSGGLLRDLLRILAEIIRRTYQLPIDASGVNDAVNQIRSEFLPIPDADAAWLVRIDDTHRAGLEKDELLPNFARFLDTHLVLVYRNGEEWYDAHPLIADVVRAQVAASEASTETETSPGETSG